MGPEGTIAIADVKRAYFEAKIQRDVCVKIPPEYWEGNEDAGDMVGKLHLSMHGTRDAAMNWQEAVAKHLVDAGFTRGISNPCAYHHAARDIITIVHGDNYVCGSWERDLT